MTIEQERDIAVRALERIAKAGMSQYVSLNDMNADRGDIASEALAAIKREQALQTLVDQAHDLDMGYGKPSTLGQQVARAQEEMATWTPEQRASVRLAGGDYVEKASPVAQDERASFDAWFDINHTKPFMPGRDGSPWDLWQAAFQACRASVAVPAEPAVPTDDFCWLVELFHGDGSGNSLGYYHTGFTDIDGGSRSTRNIYEAKRYTKVHAEQAAVKLGHALHGTWKAVWHGFITAPAAVAGLVAAAQPVGNLLAGKTCREVSPGNGYCDQCSIGDYHLCRFVAAQPVGEAVAWKYRALAGDAEWRVTMNEDWARSINGEHDVEPLYATPPVEHDRRTESINPPEFPKYMGDNLYPSMEAAYRCGCLDGWRTGYFAPVAQDQDAAELRKNYDELLYAVASKFPNETRHETALRYIRRSEASSLSTGTCVINGKV